MQFWESFSRNSSLYFLIVRAEINEDDEEELIECEQCGELYYNKDLKKAKNIYGKTSLLCENCIDRNDDNNGIYENEKLY
jgi:formylmethanofuran dehydrogenase subunit E